MKKVFVFFCLFLTVLGLYARGIQDDFVIADEKARVSYSLGMIIASNFLRSSGIDIDYDAFTEGVKSIVEENLTPQFSENEAMDIIETALQESMERISAENRLIEEDFLMKNMGRPNVFVTPSGLQYEILVDADGEKPESDSIVRVNYIGTFTDGTPFDSSADEEDGAYIPLDMVIPGFTEGAMLMSVGSTYRLYIPSSLAYGREGIQSIIPPYTTLIYTVDMLEILSADYFNDLYYDYYGYDDYDYYDYEGYFNDYD